MKIAIASTNPVKINSTLEGFREMFPGQNFETQSVSVESGVLSQPLSDAETLRGAINRAENVSIESPDADFWVGIEGGVEKVGEEMEAFAWIAIKNKDGIIGKGKSGTFMLPPKVVELINQGKELGDADDIVFGHSNSKQKNGAVGLLTGDVIDRTKNYKWAVILALIPFKNPQLYIKEGQPRPC